MCAFCSSSADPICRINRMKRPALFTATLALAMALAGATASAAAPGYDTVRLSDIDFSYNAPAEGKACCGALTALGKATNTSDLALEDPVFEVQFFDAQGKLIDAFNDVTYGLKLPPGQDMMVSLSGRARYEAGRYASAQIRLISGAFTEAGSGPQAPAFAQTVWMRLLLNWGPMLLLIGVWLWLVRRSGGSTYSRDLLASVQEQNQLLARQAAALERLADHASARDARDAQT
ncbi:hypothetical protein CLI92_11750 [Vandammella animalimorsus]|uniref:Uncharacterized protein n=2 Tax=Vandammella animalimorsus TaxID=2029117 RepID=A0A2A2T319_9BURK|nr:hypothetical protein CLI92_11750 [Vandammella animalimorsus]PAX17676.1 hypothetical protein CLI93_12735 [Vandammella animalimorsus]